MTSIAEFASGYAERSKITLEKFWQWFIVLPCRCDYEEGAHWAAIRRDDATICDHLAFHCPETGDLIKMSSEATERYLEERSAELRTE